MPKNCSGGLKNQSFYWTRTVPSLIVLLPHCSDWWWGTEEMKEELELYTVVYYLLSQRYFYYFHYFFQLLCRKERFLTKGKYVFWGCFISVYNFLGNTIFHIPEESWEKWEFCYSILFQQRIISVEVYRHGSFWKTVNCHLPTLHVYQPVENSLLCYEGPEIQFAHCYQTQKELQQLNVISKELSPPTISLQEFKFIIASRITLLQMCTVLGRRICQVPTVMRELAVPGKGASG